MASMIPAHRMIFLFRKPMVATSISSLVPAGEETQPPATVQTLRYAVRVMHPALGATPVMDALVESVPQLPEADAERAEECLTSCREQWSISAAGGFAALAFRHQMCSSRRQGIWIGCGRVSAAGVHVVRCGRFP